MKTRLLALLLLAGIFFYTDAYGSMYMGGEITWECMPNGRYRFTLKVYQECYTQNGNNAAQFSANQTIYASGGGNSTILMTRLTGYPVDVSPQCNSNPAFSRILCQGMTNGAANMGAIQEHVFTSDSAFPVGVQLSGVPTPGIGWTFAWGNSLTNGICCRNPSANVINSGSTNWWLRAKMYGYNNQNVNPCFDSSPQFAEVPVSVICSGYPFEYHHLAHDNEKDSLTYEWGQPMISSNQTITQYAAGYSFNSPLPGVSHDTNNVSATLDSNTGLISFTSFTTGSFISCVKVTAWKCGIKVAEIWREIQFVILPCSPNNPPDFLPPFVNPSTGIKQMLDTTVYACDFVSFNLMASDLDLLPDMQPQSLTMEAMGPQFGLNYSNMTVGCLQPPCATLTPPPPITAASAVQTTFNWWTDCAHLVTYLGCGTTTNVFHFDFKITDDFCPVPAQTIRRITVTVVGRPTLPPPDIGCIEVLAGGDTELSWIPVDDPDGIFDKFYIFTSNSPTGPFTVLDSIENININSYLHTGANANTNPVYYFTRTVSTCKCVFLDINSEIAGTMNLSLDTVNAGKGIVSLNWNSKSPNLTQSGEVFNVYREFPSGVWTMIDTTSALTYVDTAGYCNEYVNYRIAVADTMALDSNNLPIICFSYSNVAGAFLSDITPPDVPVLNSLSVGQINQANILKWSRTNSGDTEAYIVYRQDSGSFSPLDTVWGIYANQYVDYSANPCHGFPAYTVAAVDSCGNVSAMGNSIEIYKMQAVYDDIDDAIRLSWQAPAGQLPDVYEYTLYRSVNYGNWNVYLHVSPPGAGHNQYFPDNNSVYCYYLSARNQDSSMVVNSCPECIIKGVYTGVQSSSETGGIRVFPNPAGDYLSVSGLTQPSQVYIYDYSGKHLFKKEIQESNLDISSLSSGFYIMRIISGEESYFFSFVKQ